MEVLAPKLMFEIQNEAFWSGWREGRRTSAEAVES